MKILLLGKNGQLGYELQRTLSPLGDIIALSRRELDLIDKRAIRKTIRISKPDLIVNAAAYNAVDKAEEEPEPAMVVNGVAPGILAEEAAMLKCALVHYSTDYVFDGVKNSPYREDDPTNPLNAYGRSKLAGEEAVRLTEAAHLILRTSWLYGLRGRNFLLSVLSLARQKAELSIVDDQIGCPTWSRLVAEATAQIIAIKRSKLANLKGTYNLCCEGQASWYDFAREIMAQAELPGGKLPDLKAIKSAKYAAAAARPAYSVLDCSKLKETFGLKLPDWPEALTLSQPWSR